MAGLDPILPYRDENAGLEAIEFRQQNSVGRFPSGKQAGLQSARKALGNITNAGKAAGPRKAVIAPVEAIRKSTATTSRSVDKDELEDDADARLDALVRGGLERPMGMVHDEQQATREVALMEVGAVDVARHGAGVLKRAAGLCGSVRGVEEARRRAAVDAVFSCPFDSGVDRDMFEREELVEGAEDILGVLDDDLCNLGDVVLP